MTCIQWHDDDVLAEQFFATASEEELRTAYEDLSSSVERWRQRHPETAQRLEKLAERLYEFGGERFGDDFNIPF